MRSRSVGSVIRARGPRLSSVITQPVEEASGRNGPATRSFFEIDTFPVLANTCLGVLVASAIVWAGPPGPDLPAHLFQLDLYLKHGFELWTNYWYAGRYTFVGYSLLYYPLAALVGIKPLAVLSVAVSAAAFTVLVGEVWKDTSVWVARLFALGVAATLVTAAFPYGLGVAFGLTALIAISRGRSYVFALLALCSAAASPLAFLFLLLVLAAAWLSGSRGSALRPAAASGAICAAGLVLWRLFPDPGRYPFPTSELLAGLCFCAGGAALTWRQPPARLLRIFFVIYGLLCVASYVLPTTLGGNVVRLRYVALPLTLLALSLRRWRPLPVSVAAIALSLFWNVSPLAYSVLRSSRDPSATSSYWAPIISFLHRSLSPNYRVEAVGTANHWEAIYLPQAAIPIVRGWFRQDDFPENKLLYQTPTPRSYLAWLRALSVRYVVLTNAAPDYSARLEAVLLRSGQTRLPVVFRTSNATIYRVPAPRAIITGPGGPEVITSTDSTVTLDLKRAGTYRLAIRYSPYLDAPGACLTKTTDGMTAIRITRRAFVHVTFDVSTAGAIAALTGTSTPCRATG